jgi:hypothetical protein
MMKVVQFLRAVGMRPGFALTLIEAEVVGAGDRRASRSRSLLLIERHDKDTLKRNGFGRFRTRICEKDSQ